MVEDKKKGFLARLFDKLDAGLEKKSKSSCCCGSCDSKESDKGCCD